MVRMLSRYLQRSVVASAATLLAVLPISVEQLKNAFVNDLPAAEIAKVAKEGDPALLEAADLHQVFALSERDARLVARRLAAAVERRRGERRLSITFAEIPMQLAVDCADGRVLTNLQSWESCLVVRDTSDAAARIPRGRWGGENYRAIVTWLEELALYRPEVLAVFLDCDNTAWAGDVADVAMKVGVESKLITWERAPILPGFPFERGAGEEAKTPLDYYEHLYAIDPIVSYNYAAQAFAGLSLAEADQIFRRAQRDPTFPIGYAELSALANELAARGVTVGFVSASPLFLVAPMLERAGYRAPLWAVEGIDSYVADPRDPNGVVRLGNLVHTSGLASWREVLKRFGHLQITGRVSEVAMARSGKTAGAAAIAARRIQQLGEVRTTARPVTLDHLRSAAVFGDNFGPFSDLVGAEPIERGNDQGMLRALPFLPDAIVVDIYRAVVKEGKLDLAKKRSKYENFRRMMQQIEPLYPINRYLVQVAVSDGEGRGFHPLSITPDRP